MKITFSGAAQAVTGSMHAISIANETPAGMGLLQGHRREAFQINSHLPFAAKSIHSVVLSHVHLDHSGNLILITRFQAASALGRGLVKRHPEVIFGDRCGCARKHRLSMS